MNKIKYMSSENIWTKIISRFGAREVAITLLLIFEIILFSSLTDYFLTFGNLRSILMNSVDLAIVSIGMTLVMIMGGIDVSVGSVLGVIAILVSQMLKGGINPVLIVIAGIAMGGILGSINGLIIGLTNVPSIITTLGTMNIFRAAIFGLLGGRWISGVPPVFSFLNNNFLGIPLTLPLIILLYILFWIFSRYRKFGRSIYAIGNNQEAARLAGINIKKTYILAYVIVGALTGVASITYIARMGGVEITIGNDLPLQAIAAVVIGGTSVTGGRGSVLGTLLGVFFINIMQNGVLLMGIPSLWERAVIGVLIIISIASDLIMNKQSSPKMFKG